MMFTQFHSGAPVCSPARAALLTGKNASSLGVYNWVPDDSPMHLRSEETTIAEMLRSAGYRTGHFGKWHLASESRDHPTPTQQGFDYAFWTYGNSKPTNNNPVNFIRNQEPLGTLEGYSSHLVVDDVKRWTTTLLEADQPFFANIWFHEPHRILKAPDSLKVNYTENETYYAAIQQMDMAIGNLIEHLAKHQVLENTIVMFTSDNGSLHTTSNLPYSGKKGLLYEGGLTVPFIVSQPGSIARGSVSHQVADFVDIFTTLSRLADNSNMRDSLDGMDISEIITGNEVSLKRDSPLFYYRYFQDPICMLRNDSLILFGYQREPIVRDDYGGIQFQNLFDRIPGDTLGSHWPFNPIHMDSILVHQPRFFSLYNLKTDTAQLVNIRHSYSELFAKMKKTMLSRLAETKEQGGDWF